MGLQAAIDIDEFLDPFSHQGHQISRAMRPTHRQTMFFEASKFQVVLSSSNIVAYVLNLVAGIKTDQSIQHLTFQYQYHHI